LASFELVTGYFLGSNAKNRGILIMPYFEVYVLLLFLVISALSVGSAWYNRPWNVALWGSSSIVRSYILMVVLLPL